MFMRLQKKYGGKWVATSENAEKVYASADSVGHVFELLKAKKISPQKAVIGYIKKYGRVSIYLSL